MRQRDNSSSVTTMHEPHVHTAQLRIRPDTTRALEYKRHARIRVTESKADAAFDLLLLLLLLLQRRRLRRNRVVPDDIVQVAMAMAGTEDFVAIKDTR